MNKGTVKKAVLRAVIDLMFLIVFNALFFVLGGTDHPVSVWISYGFIHLAYFAVIATPLLTKKSSSSYVFGFTIYTISSCYFFIELILGIIFIFAAQESYLPALFVQGIVFAVYIVISFTNLIANEKTAESIENHELGTAYIQNSAAKVKLLADAAQSRNARKALEKLYDDIHSSPVESSPVCAQIERDIYEKICDIGDVINSNDETFIISRVNAVSAELAQRNNLLKKSH